MSLRAEGGQQPKVQKLDSKLPKTRLYPLMKFYAFYDLISARAANANLANSAAWQLDLEYI